MTDKGICPRRVLAVWAKTRGGILEVPACKGGKFHSIRKNLNFSRTGLARYCRKVREVQYCRNLLGVEETLKGVREHSLCTRFWSGKGRAVIKWKKIISTSIRFRVKIAETHIEHSYRKFICWKIAQRDCHTWICRTQIKPNWARKTHITIQKFIQWLRKGQKTGLVKLAYFQSSRGVEVAFG